MKSNVLLVALSAAVLVSCGSSGGAGTDQTTPLQLSATNFVTIPTIPTTVAAVPVVPGSGAAGVPGSVHAEEGSYTIAANDYPSTVAKKFNVAMTDLLAVNGWTLVGDQVPGWPAAGSAIKIPPGWTEPGATTAPPAATSDTTATNTSVAAGTGDTTPPASANGSVPGSCAPGEYTITAEDTSRLKVAKKLDTTVEALDAANANTKGYSAFYPGLKIKTPPKAGC